MLASLCAAAVICCLLLPVETMGRALSRRATLGRATTLVLERCRAHAEEEQPCEAALVRSNSSQPPEGALAGVQGS